MNVVRDRLALVAGAGLLAMMALCRLWAVGRHTLEAYECATCLAGRVLLHDAPVYGGLIVLAYLAAATLGAVRIAALATLVLGVVIYLADVAALGFFARRLRIGEAAAYVADIQNTWSVMNALADRWALVVILMLGLGGIWLLHSVARRRRQRWPPVILAVGASLMCFALLPSRSMGRVNPWLYQNVIELHVQSGVHIGYSPDFRRRVLAESQDENRQCRSSDPTRENVIVVLVESLSSYHSRAFSGLADLTPELDRIASQGRSYTWFVANGHKTSTGLVAALAGRPDIPRVGAPFRSGGRPFDHLPNGPPPLPEALSAGGYWTEFLTTGDLGFEEKGDWLRSIGFDRVEGSEHSGYAHYKRFAFNAAPDEALYRRALERLEELREGERPYLLVLLTVSTHFPFTHPVSGERSLAGVMRYADQQLGRFYEDLEDGGYLDDTLLVITSDHRSMTPVSRREAALFGRSAAGRVPLVVIGLGQSGVVDEPFQLSDLPASLARRLIGQGCFDEFTGDLFSSPPRPPECVISARGDEYDLVDVFCGQSEGTIKLDGDETRVVQGTIPRGEEVLRWINADRIRRSYSLPSTWQNDPEGVTAGRRLLQRGGESEVRQPGS